MKSVPSVHHLQVEPVQGRPVHVLGDHVHAPDHLVHLGVGEVVLILGGGVPLGCRGPRGLGRHRAAREARDDSVLDHDLAAIAAEDDDKKSLL